MHESVWDASVSAGFKLRLPCAIFSSKIRLISATVSGRASQWMTDRDISASRKLGPLGDHRLNTLPDAPMLGKIFV
jgi:hypothetical protein